LNFRQIHCFAEKLAQAGGEYCPLVDALDIVGTPWSCFLIGEFVNDNYLQFNA
jgi:hypothetical protein